MPSKGTWEQTKADWNQWVVPPKILRLVKIIIKDHCSNCILERAEYGEMRPSRCKKCFFNKAKEFTKEHTARKS